MNTQYKLKKTALAVALSLLATTASSIAATAEDEAMEEVVVKASRLQGSAAAVVEERRNQAFVADILGAEQMSKTGDSDAASALRRVTGLTLVDGKYVYVRGLGERYSSARLNGANIPSPDLTRNVIPLDLFPSSIIESLSVQKAYSPSMPAAFGGGNIDVRTKSVPNEFVGNIEVGVGYDDSSTDGFTYNGNKSGMSSVLRNAVVDYKGRFNLANIIETDGISTSDAIAKNNMLLKELPRNMVMKEESLNPAYNIKATIGNSIEEDYFGGQIGFLASIAYDNEWTYSNIKSGVTTTDVQPGCAKTLNNLQDKTTSCYNTLSREQVTTQAERLSAVLNVGYKLKNHELSIVNIYLEDSEDETSIKNTENPINNETIQVDGIAKRSHEFNYEERQLEVTQFLGKHTFIDYWGLGFDWQYTESEANTEIPTDARFSFFDTYVNGEYQKSEVVKDDNRALFSFVDLQDNVTSYSGNLNLPLYFDGIEVELKAGYDFSDKGRYYTTSSFGIHNEQEQLPVITDINDIQLATGYLTDDFIDNNAFYVEFNEPRNQPDDYLAGQKISAYYGAFDVIFDGLYRISGGLRYEDFKQTSLATSSLIFTAADLNRVYSEEKILNGTINEDGTYTALSFTYLGGEDYQLRLGYGETVVRPDLREVVPVGYYDPLTDIYTFGAVGLESSDLKNYDARFEFYGDNGNNYSVGLFYKDITAPIEAVLSVGDENYSMSFVNGDQAEVYGMEVEWLKDLTFISDGLFTSGNITLSDSETSIAASQAGNLTNPTKRMTGHSKYVVNFQLNYDSANGNHSSSLVYNVFGERILAAGIEGRDDAYEQPLHSFDVVYTYYPDFNSKLKFKLKNILDEDQEVTQGGVVVRSKEMGREFSVSYSYDF